MKKFLLLLIILVLGITQWWFKDPSISVPGSDISFGYLVKYAGDSNRNDYLPMLVALHGNGDTASNFYETALDQLKVPVRIILLKGPLSYGRGSAWPWSAADFKQYGDAVNEAIKLLAHKFPTRGKPVLLGFSGGGMMAYYQAVKHGDSYSSIFPVSGRLSRDLLGDELSRPGAEVIAFHGRNDSVISVAEGRNAVDILQDNDIEVKFTAFDGGHLGIFIDEKANITRAVEQKLVDLM